MSERTSSSDRLRQMASDYEKAVSEARSEQLAARAVARALTTRPLRRPFGVAVIGVSMLLLMVAALGMISARSLPGDTLYDVSRAYEEAAGWVGVGDPVEQRLHEAIALAERGDAVRAAQAATEALEELERTTDLVLVLPPATTSTTRPGTSEETTPTTTPSSASVEGSPEGAAEDSVQTLKLAAELLLNRVQNNGGELDTAAAGLAKAVDDLVVVDDPVPTEDTSTTISPTTTIPDSTTTTESEDTATTTISPTTTIPDSTTTTESEDTATTTISPTTTIPDSTTTTESEDTATTTTTIPSSTTTTVPEGDDDEASDGEGPIFIPPQP